MKRSDRLVSLTNYFLENPKKHTTLKTFMSHYDVAKSSISEDVEIINRVFQTEGLGGLVSNSGAQGGVVYNPDYAEKQGRHFIAELCDTLGDPARILPGGYLYMSDLLGDPHKVKEIGRVFASRFNHQDIDVVMTVATKGIPLAYATAAYLDVPVVIVRRDPKITEGSSVSINYVAGSSRRVQTMVLPRRSLQDGANVCIIDDFMKAGGTITGMKSLLAEFNAQVAAVGVLAEADDEEDECVVEDYTSLVKIKHVDLNQQQIEVVPGNIHR